MRTIGSNWKRLSTTTRSGLYLLCGWVHLAGAVSAAETGRLVRLEQSLERAATFLAQAQGADGAWRSDRYGTFRDDTALTPLALMSLLHLPGHTAAVSRAASFVTTCAGRDDFDYPVYTASLALLEAHRFSAAQGWTMDDNGYGGWGYTVALPVRTPACGEYFCDGFCAGRSSGFSR